MSSLTRKDGSGDGKKKPQKGVLEIHQQDGNGKALNERTKLTLPKTTLPPKETLPKTTLYPMTKMK